MALFLAPARIVFDYWLPDYKYDPWILPHYFHPTNGTLLKPQVYKYGRIWKDDKILVPRRRIPEVIAAHHDPIVAGQWGIHRTKSLIQRRFTFPKMRFWILNHCRSCDVCQHAKSDHHYPRGLMDNVSLPLQKWQSVAMDWICGLPAISRNGITYDQVLTITDRATKMTHLIPTFQRGFRRGNG